MNPSLFIN